MKNFYLVGSIGYFKSDINSDPGILLTLRFPKKFYKYKTMIKFLSNIAHLHGNLKILKHENGSYYTGIIIKCKNKSIKVKF